MSEDTMIAIVAISAGCGGPLLWGIVDTIASNWRKVRLGEQHTLLKREMIERGYLAEEIVRVLEAGGPNPATGQSAVQPAPTR